jgi:hypothetical protein
MSEKPSKPATPEKDLMDAIADALPAEVQAEYYRVMAHLRNLPENDELLIVLQAIQFLGLLMEQIPSQIMAERKELQGLWNEIAETIAKLLKAEGGYYKELDRRLTELPESIAKGISPAAIVGQITDVLKKQFDLTTIPATAKELAGNAETINVATKKHAQAFEKMCGAWNSAETRTKKAIEGIEAKSVAALAATESAADAIAGIFCKSYYALLVACSVTFFALGITLGPEILSTAKQIISKAAPVQTVQAMPSIPGPAQRRK